MNTEIKVGSLWRLKSAGQNSRTYKILLIDNQWVIHKQVEGFGMPPQTTPLKRFTHSFAPAEDTPRGPTIHKSRRYLVWHNSIATMTWSPVIANSDAYLDLQAIPYVWRRSSDGQQIEWADVHWQVD